MLRKHLLSEIPFKNVLALTVLVSSHAVVWQYLSNGAALSYK